MDTNKAIFSNIRVLKYMTETDIECGHTKTTLYMLAALTKVVK